MKLSKRSMRIIVLALLIMAAMSTMASDCDGPPVEGKIENIDRGGNVTVCWPNGSKSTIKDYEVSGAISEGACVSMDVFETKSSTCK